MQLLGTSIIGSTRSAPAEKTFSGFNPKQSKPLAPAFYEATLGDLNRAAQLAAEAAPVLRNLAPSKLADFLLAVREEILALGEPLIERASQESGLDPSRLNGERDRTTNQLKLFAELVREGSWVDARIETPLPDRKPVPRPDLRRMLRGIGPVAVFGASNFPLAFSVAGGDTAAALAAGNPVIVKGHPAHPGTSELVASAVAAAVKKCGLPEGTLSLLQSTEPAFSIALVSHPVVAAVGFTGSERAGRALFDAAAKRPVPIPVYAEMGSVNPIFVLPQALRERADAIAEGVFKSVTPSSGQFCTCPGLVFVVEDAGLDSFVAKLEEQFEEGVPGTMLTPGIAKAFETHFEQAASVEGVSTHRSARAADASQNQGRPGLIVVDSTTWFANDPLQHEIFGPSTIIVRCSSVENLLASARALSGNLTATIHSTAGELPNFTALIDTLTQKAGRIICNGYPTGVEVGSAMHHGGPYPATTDSKFTSVGTASILRFARPVCFQNFPQALLPAELQDANPAGIWRQVNGAFVHAVPLETA
jgi:alpha-ketoglutaric semialdehyde dehydrogenase